MNKTDNLYFACTLIYIVIGQMARQGGSLLFIGYSVVIVFYCFKSSSWYKIDSLIIFVFIGFLYILLSYLGLLPDAWTRYYVPSIIPRQAFFVFVIYPFITASMSFWKKVLQNDKMGFYCWLSIITLISINPLINYYNDPLMLNDNGNMPILFTGLMNPCLFFLFCLSYLVMVQYRNKALITIPIITAVGLFDAANLQTQIAISLLFFLSFIRIKKIDFKIVFILFMIFTVYIISISPTIAKSYQNTAHRGFMWIDALKGIEETHGIGIGFGKELITNYYYYLDKRTQASFDEILVFGIHNSFLSMFFRMGILGGISFFWFFFITCFPRLPEDTMLLRHVSFAFIIALLSLFVNVGIESPMAMVGIVQCIGYVLACNYLFGNKKFQIIKIRI